VTGPASPAAVTLNEVPRWRAFVGLGGNVGEVGANLLSALAAINALPATRIEAVSSQYQTRPVDAGGPDYLNAVVAIQCGLGPMELLGALLALESQHDRQRPYHHAPRTLDLDLLWFGGTSRDTPRLHLPHPRMLQRAFVLEPLAEVLGKLAAQDSSAASTGLVGVHGIHNLQQGPNLPDEATRASLASAQGITRLGPMAWPA
jgi:2-amino-4-hydroxy-6-hydroxymethyldihydropteridine diphosphokinase